MSAAPSQPPGAWRSKPWRGVAHFILPSGQAACVAILPLWMVPSASTEWRRLREDDHLCKVCRTMQPAICMCSACKADRAGGVSR